MKALSLAQILCALALLIATACGGPMEPDTLPTEESGDVRSSLVSAWTKIGTFNKSSGPTQSAVAWIGGKVWATAGNTVQIRNGTLWTQTLSLTYNAVALGASSSYSFVGSQYTAPKRGALAGGSWTTVGATLYPEPNAFVRDPAYGSMYVDMAGTLARSNNHGTNWTEIAYGDAPYGCRLATAPYGGRIYQGCSGYFGGWVAWVDSSNPNASSVTPEVLVDDSIAPNRWLPTSLAVSKASGLAYAGMAGGLIYMNGTDWGWVYDDATDPVTVTAIWLDPANSDHLMFGGVDISINKVVVYETWDHGMTVDRTVAPAGLGLSNPDLKSFTASGASGEKMVISVESGTSTRQTVIIEVTP